MPDDRESAAAYALASVRAEGLEPGPETEADLAEFVDGKIDTDEVVARALARARARHGGQASR